MKLLITALLALSLFSCNNSDTKTTGKDSIPMQTPVADTSKAIASTDSAREQYCYITGIEKGHDSILIKADYVEFFNGKNVLEEAKKRHRADTAFDKNGKVQDIFVPDDYFIVNDNKQLRTLYLPANTPIKMESEFVTDKKKEINNYEYFSGHYKNSLFMLTVKGNNVTAVREIFLP